VINHPVGIDEKCGHVTSAAPGGSREDGFLLCAA
jgi:hypothetical protein